MAIDDVFTRLEALATGLGAYRAKVIPVDNVETDVSFRELCAKNVCGNYGKCWTCPPDVGEIDALIAKLRSFEYILVYQYVGTLEDSFDFEGMMDAALKHNELTAAVRAACEKETFRDRLYLCAGGCRICPVCAKKTNEPCRHPGRAMASLESCGMDVSGTTKNTAMKYINGADTVTYFGMVLYNERQNG
ncbi:MAG: DUF2284 domain-containing protein [Clostridia bacterium]|nr:DUF2284 domain-containing protein [Clostridia bacterium]